MSDGFQTQVTNQPVPAIAGDFASMNPMWTYDAGPGGLVAGDLGLTAGLFAWTVGPVDGDGSPSKANNFGTGSVAGFVPRDQQGLITNYLQIASMRLPAGFECTLFIGGDFWVKNDGATQALPGQKAYANFADGKVTFAATASPTAGATSSASAIAAKTATTTASLFNDQLTVTAQSGDPIVAGAILGSGSGVVAGTSIVSQNLPLHSGEALGGIGRYTVSVPEQNVSSEAMTFTYGLLTVGGTVAGAFGVGQTLTGSGITASTVITQLGTGVGGAGTYYVNKTQTISSQEIDTVALNVETKWFCRSSGLPGEVVKISSQPLG